MENHRGSILAASYFIIVCAAFGAEVVSKMINETPVEHLPGTSKLTINRLKHLEIATYADLLNYFPFRYEDYPMMTNFYQLKYGEKITVKGKIAEIKNTYTKKGGLLSKAIISYDQNNSIEAVWFNQAYISRLLKPAMLVAIAGSLELFGRALVIHVEQYEILTSLNQETIHTARLVPIYPETRGLSSKTMREKIWYVLDRAPQDELFPEKFIRDHKLMEEQKAYRAIHFPKNREEAKLARRRLAFDELSLIQLSALLVKKQWEKENVSTTFIINDAMISEFTRHLPFTLTNAQKRCIGELMSDLARKQPMNRLLQGEVGSGKTVVAAAAAYIATRNRYKTLFLAPTEILAFQHFETLKKLFVNSRMPHAPSIVLYTASSKPKKGELEKKDIVVGTHAILTAKDTFSPVGLAIVDEQHKFGVVQRAQLKEKGINPHLFTMTATPIPRTVILTLYGELDMSVIDEMPQGRVKTKTYLVPDHKRENAYAWIKKQIQTLGIQVFIVCPFIEESHVETMASVKAARKEFDRLQKSIFPKHALGLLHGKMKSREKEAVMKDFLEKRVDILVSTPVVEVGIDISNAAVIIIEAAERFGLSQLHQLRGRVGRGDKQSYCLLFTEKTNPRISHRLTIFTRVHNGFELAEYDLQLRGSGEIYGTRQHGAAELKVASFTDFHLIEETRKAMIAFVRQHRLADFAHLQNRLKKYTIAHITRD